MELSKSVMRWLCRGKRPHRLARNENWSLGPAGCQGSGAHGLTQLEVVGGKSGKPVSFPVVVAHYDGGRYLVSMLGEDHRCRTQHRQ